jgi:hypothetical protein
LQVSPYANAAKTTGYTPSVGGGTGTGSGWTPRQAMLRDQRRREKKMLEAQQKGIPYVETVRKTRSDRVMPT